MTRHAHFLVSFCILVPRMINPPQTFFVSRGVDVRDDPNALDFYAHGTHWRYVGMDMEGRCVWYDIGRPSSRGEMYFTESEIAGFLPGSE